MDFDLDDDDDWFYDSIKRYKQLQMFELENVSKQLQFSDEKSICIASTDKNGHDEILELSLPKKLTVAAEQEGLTKNCDLKIKSGGFLRGPLVQMKVLRGKRKIIASEKDLKGVSVYQLGSEDSDVISRINAFHCELLEPRLTINNTNLLVLTTTNNEGLMLMDITTGRIMDTIKWDTETKKHIVEPAFTSPCAVALCNIESGTVHIVDVRTKLTSCSISPDNLEVNKEEWTISSSFLGYPNEDVNPTSSTNLGLLSTMGTVCIYDLRNIKYPICKGSVDQRVHLQNTTPAHSVITFQFCPANPSIISVSGFDDNVYIYDTLVSNDLKTVFIHDGHAKQCNIGKNNHVTCHVWYQENTVISASENKSLHCWQYVTS